MKLTKAPSKIIGVRVGEIHIELLKATRISVSFVLLRDPEKSEGINAGRYTKENDFPPKVIDAYQALIVALEEGVLPELFETKDTRLEDLELNTGLASEKDEGDNKDKLDFPTLGGGDENKKGTPQF